MNASVPLTSSLSFNKRVRVQNGKPGAYSPHTRRSSFMLFENSELQTLSITIIRAKNLKGSRGTTVNSTAKVEFGEAVLGESEKVVCSPTSPAEYNFCTNLGLEPGDPLGLDDLIASPLVITITEILPKDNQTIHRQKEERKIIYQCCLDHVPFLKGTRSLNQSLNLNPIFDRQDSYHLEDNYAELDVRVIVNEPLLNQQELEESNIMTITVGSLFSPPQSWSQTGPQYTYIAAMPVPFTREKELLAIFSNGKLRARCEDNEEPNMKKKWANPGTAQGNAVYIPDKFVFSDPIEEEDGDFKDDAFKDRRYIAELEKLRVTWNMEKSCYIESSAIKGFKRNIGKYQYWPVEIFRLPHQNGGKAKKDDDVSISFHGVAFVNLFPLLYPGVKRIKGAYKIVEYSDYLLDEKTNRKITVSEDVLKSQNCNVTHTPTMVKDGIVVDRKLEVKKVDKWDKFDISEKKNNIISLQNSRSACNRYEGHPYTDAKSYIMIEICLDKPLVPKRKREISFQTASSMILTKHSFPHRIDGADKAVEEYHSKVANVASSILDEFKDLFATKPEDSGSGTEESGLGTLFGTFFETSDSKSLTIVELETKRRELMDVLKTSGKNFAFQEELKHSVLKIVREKCLMTSNFEDKRELQGFLSELYVYLIDQMNTSLSKTLVCEHQPQEFEFLHPVKSKHKNLANEAAHNQDYEAAATYHKERIARNRNNADNWFDYGVFNFCSSERGKAEECFKECLAIEKNHLHCLLMYGVLCTLGEEIPKAESFFETATRVDPDSILSWTMLGLFYDSIQIESGAEKAFLKANKIKEQKGAKSFRRTSRDIGAKKTKNEKAPSKDSRFKGSNKGILDPALLDRSIYMNAVDWLLEVRAFPFTERALGHELTTCPGGPNTAYYIALARLKKQRGEYRAAKENLDKALELDKENPDTWTLKGHVEYLVGNSEEARNCYEKAISFSTCGTNIQLIDIRLGSIYLQEERYQDAKKTFLMGSKVAPSCVSWLGAGIACYRLGQFSEAEDCLCEANALNNNDPEVWAYLSLVCLKTDRKLEAEQAYKYAVRLKLEKEPLLEELHREQKAVNYRFKPIKALFDIASVSGSSNPKRRQSVYSVYQSMYT